MNSGSAHPSSFLYRELNGKRTIRLLKFLPPNPTCTLIHVGIDKAPPYLALSYTWGSQIRDHSVIVNGQSLSINKNLADALSAMHDTVRARKLMFWADAICINQRDIRERSHQVRFMNTIYRCAEYVAIWLGKAYAESDFLMAKMEEWKVEFDRIYEACGTDYTLAAASLFPSLHLFHGPDGSNESHAWHAFHLLCRREWWRRAWIVQEATSVGPSRAYLVCGDRSVSWTCLRAILHIGHIVSQYDGQGMSIDYDQGMAIRIDGFRMERECGAHMYLLRVLRHIRCYECEDPRDKVFASLGMACDVSEGDIVPDYSKSVVSVFTDVVRFALRNSNGHALDFLGYVVRPAMSSRSLRDVDEMIPSWVPDWQTRCSFFEFEKFIEMDAFESPKAYNASGDYPVDANIDGQTLQVRGFPLDVIVEVLPLVEENLAEAGASIERSWMPTNPNERYHNGELLGQAFNRTILADIGRANLDSDNELARGFSMD